MIDPRTFAGSLHKVKDAAVAVTSAAYEDGTRMNQASPQPKFYGYFVEAESRIVDEVAPVARLVDELLDRDYETYIPEDLTAEERDELLEESARVLFYSSYVRIAEIISRCLSWKGYVFVLRGLEGELQEHTKDFTAALTDLVIHGQNLLDAIELENGAG